MKRDFWCTRRILGKNHRIWMVNTKKRIDEKRLFEEKETLGDLEKGPMLTLKEKKGYSRHTHFLKENHKSQF